MQSSDFSQRSRVIMMGIALVMGAFLVIVAPILIQATLSGLMEEIATLLPEQPGMRMPTILLPIWFFIFRGLAVLAGVTLLVTAGEIRKGRSWSWPLCLTCLSIPALTGVFISLPYLVQFGKPAPAALVLVLSLIAYFWVLLLKIEDRVTKVARVVTFALLGIVPAHVIVLVNHGIKELIVRPEHPLFSDPMTTIYGFETPLNFFVFLFCVAAIPLLAAGKEADWWLGLIAGVTAVIANYPTHFIRMQTSDFFVGGTLGLLLVISLVYPGFRRRIGVFSEQDRTAA
ncbi:MAG: hypothetical protein P1P76_02580 [Anaerolineales bacterium]|nr:hypothetical protein [Anaerolineales bacterium]